MFDSALAFARYRREVVRSWPDSAVKDQLLGSIECSLRRNGQSRGQLDSQAGSGELEVGRDAMGQPGSEMASSPAPAHGSFLKSNRPQIGKIKRAAICSKIPRLCVDSDLAGSEEGLQR
jgi:hypothetical protein